MKKELSIKEQVNELLNGEPNNGNVIKMLAIVSSQLSDLEQGGRRMMTLKDASTYTGYSVKTLRYLAKNNQISYSKPTDGGSGKMFFSRDDLDAYMSQNRVPSKFEIDTQASTRMIGA